MEITDRLHLSQEAEIKLIHWWHDMEQLELWTRESLQMLRRLSAATGGTRQPVAENSVDISSFNPEVFASLRPVNHFVRKSVPIFGQSGLQGVHLSFSISRLFYFENPNIAIAILPFTSIPFLTCCILSCSRFAQISRRFFVIHSNREREC